MKTLLTAALFAATFAASFPAAGIDKANAFRNERIAVCDWYRTKAQSYARRGNIERSDHYWDLFRACMNHRID